LVVEDNPLIQAVVQDALTDAGYDVTLASTGDEAIAKLDVTGPDVGALITDVDLPPGKLTGWDVARHAREIDHPRVFPKVSCCQSHLLRNRSSLPFCNC
jgi:CheY-like chemotaxis protein